MTRVFVYGTLRPGQSNYGWALHGKTIEIAPATLAGARLWNNGAYPFMTMDGSADDLVFGDVVTVKDAFVQQVMSDLDRLEGYTPGYAGNLYDRVQVSADTVDGRVKAWTYVTSAGYANHVVARLPRIAGGDWLTRESLYAR